MVELKLSDSELQYLTLITRHANVLPLDCVDEKKYNALGVLLKPEDVGKFFGKNGSNLRQLKKGIGGVNIIVVQSSEAPEPFLLNAFKPVKPKSVKVLDLESSASVSFQQGDRFKVSRHRIEIVKRFAERRFGIKEVRVSFTQ